VDELRRGIEALPARQQYSLSYYEKWAVSMTNILLERGVVTLDELYHDGEEKFDSHLKVGDMVAVRSESTHLPWPKPHLRTPGYVYGAIGEIVADCGKFHNPELLAFRRKGPMQNLYRVRFLQKDLWEHYEGDSDTAVVEIYSPWLYKCDRPKHEEAKRASNFGIFREKEKMLNLC